MLIGTHRYQDRTHALHLYAHLYAMRQQRAYMSPVQSLQFRELEGHFGYAEPAVAFNTWGVPYDYGFGYGDPMAFGGFGYGDPIAADINQMEAVQEFAEGDFAAGEMYEQAAQADARGDYFDAAVDDSLAQDFDTDGY